MNCKVRGKLQISIEQKYTCYKQQWPNKPFKQQRMCVWVCNKNKKKAQVTQEQTRDGKIRSSEKHHCQKVPENYAENFNNYVFFGVYFLRIFIKLIEKLFLRFFTFVKNGFIQKTSLQTEF